MQHSGSVFPESDRCALQMSAERDRAILSPEMLVWLCQKIMQYPTITVPPLALWGYNSFLKSPSFILLCFKEFGIL